MSHDTVSFIALCTGLLVFLLVVSVVSKNYSLNRIKSKTVGDGQHGTARWATLKEIGKTYAHIPFDVAHWRKGERLPQKQGVVVGSMGGGKKERQCLAVLGRTAVRYVKRIWKKRKNGQYTDEPELIRALVDSDDIHCLMIGASGVGKTAYFLYPNLEYTCASGMSFLALDSKGDLARNYGAVASKYYGYQVSVVDLRNPTCSDGYNLLTLINRYMDLAVANPDDLKSRAKSEKYAKILSNTIIYDHQSIRRRKHLWAELVLLSGGRGCTDGDDPAPRRAPSSNKGAAGGAEAYRLRLQAGAGAPCSNWQRAEGKERLPVPYGDDAGGSQGEVVFRLGSDHGGAKRELRHVHGARTAQCLSRFRARAGALLR